ncbi:MAG: hypothetical protein RSB98_02890 [Raoultibacter sp.]
MSDLSMFLKKNKKIRENAFYPATKSLLDEVGKPLMWEIKPLTTAIDESIREQCTEDALVEGKNNTYRSKINVNRYMAMQMVAAVVFPNLHDAALQDSYGVKKPEDLLHEMIDSPGEYIDFGNFIRKHSGFDTDMETEVEKAKN